ncbi:hypothetical protein E5288_WYG001937 [Bos mutus]|uniref:ATM interactor n=1 Tax=Bos mutus TaxID=72004 RepID=A0A6B0RKC0_9CETA|nr:hypothetical protein [Bos mutus]
MQRIVARPSSARVAVTMPATELAMRSLQNTGIHLLELSRKTAESLSNQPIPQPDVPELETLEIKLVASSEDSRSSNAKQQTLPAAPRYPQQLLLPKPKVALVKLPIMQFSPVPVFVPTADSSAQSVVLVVDHQGSAPGAIHLLPLSIGTLTLSLDLEACSLKESLPLSKVVNPVAVKPISTGVQVNLVQNPAVDFDTEEFSASNTQTKESELSTMTTEPVLESLDTETQTDLFLADPSAQAYSCKGNSSFLGLEMFDMQTQMDLNFFLDSSPHLPLGSVLKHSSFSMSTDSSDTETQTDRLSTAKNLPALESKVQLNSAETQTMNSGFETSGSLFFTSNET